MASSGISIIIPAYNEAAFLPATLMAANKARKLFEQKIGLGTEVVVVNNASSDSTSLVALAHSARVIDHPIRNIASVRNVGIRAASFDLIVTIDADCLLPAEGLLRIWDFMKNPQMIGAALGLRLITDRFSKKILANVALFLVEIISGMNGAMFCFRREDALAFGGFRENMLIAEDRAFVQDLKAQGARENKKFKILRSVRVETWDRKDASLRTILPQLGVIFRAITGRKTSLGELDYWYKPKR